VEAPIGWLMLQLFGFLGRRRKDLKMLLKSSLSEPYWLNEANSLSEEASLLSKRKTLENVKSESCPLSVQPTHPAKPLSLLTLSVSKPQ